MPKIPKYHPRKDRDYAYVEINRRRIALPGKTNSPESLAEYGRLISEHLRTKAATAKSQPRQVSAVGLPIMGLVGEWLEYCRIHYMGTSNTASNEYDNCRYAVRPLVAKAGDTIAMRFTTDDFREVRQAMVTGAWESDANKRPPKPWARSVANASCNRIKRMFRWAIEYNRLPAESVAPLLLLSPLEKGRSIAVEAEAIEPVDPVWVAATLPCIQPIARAMVELQQVTGLRSDNVCTLRPMDIDRSGEIWIYCPSAHKGTSKEKELVVAIGPRGQAILTPFLNRPADKFCFSPQEAPKKPRGASTRYTTATYRKAVFYGITKANKLRVKAAADRGDKKPAILIPHWHPHQIRHTWGTAVKKKHKTEGARVALGHSQLKTADIYAERDLALAIEIAREMG